jgi:aryl-alcohol dehydrogenase-like predicted oxidoreductase
MVAGAEALDRAYPGINQDHRLDENVGAASVELSKSELDEIQQALGGIDVQAHGTQSIC